MSEQGEIAGCLSSIPHNGYVKRLGGRLLISPSPNMTENGFEVVDAGLQIFEKKPKEPKPDVEAEAASEVTGVPS
ncbi:hypothetical protein [Fortiea contorta]|jgi:hypothetical protein|uniref:hypothetical protein n=1 Tax=Fortiea contorta TaxID=1892405 RepID=UPI00146130F9|nr:hypothetical protein [Fortiea contorta]